MTKLFCLCTAEYVTQYIKLTML